MPDSTYLQHVDVESFARWMLAHDILGNKDGAGSNMYITKYDDSDTTLLRMGCLWDFDVIMQSQGWDELHDRYYFGGLLHSADSTYAKRYIALWDEVKDSVFDGIRQYLSDYLLSPLRQSIDASISLNNDRWASEMYALPLSDDFIAEAMEWFGTRKPWMEEAVHGITAIRPVRLNRNSQTVNGKYPDLPYFDLFGRRLNSPSANKGIYIQNGKKVIFK